MMLSELTELLACTRPETPNTEYRRLIAEENVLGKGSASNRRITFRHLGELYGLSPEMPLFRNLRRLWPDAGQGRPLLAFLCAIARDPLLRLTAPLVVQASLGTRFGTADFEEALAVAAPGRFSERTRRSAAQNAASSWTQSGHLSGHRVKIRSHPQISREAVAYSLFLAYVCGLRGPSLFTSFWASLLDRAPEELQPLADEASTANLLNLKRAGVVIEVTFPGWLSAAEEESLHESR